MEINEDISAAACDFETTLLYSAKRKLETVSKAYAQSAKKW